MLETRAIVVQTVGHHALVQADQRNGCEQCNGKGCGASKLSSLFCRKQRQFQVANPISATVGDEVVISVAEGAIFHGIGMVYVLPLLLLVLGAVLGNQWSLQVEQRDFFAAVGALFGLATGFAFAKLILLRQARGDIQPYISKLSRGEGGDLDKQGLGR